MVLQQCSRSARTSNRSNSTLCKLASCKSVFAVITDVNISVIVFLTSIVLFLLLEILYFAKFYMLRR